MQMVDIEVHQINDKEVELVGVCPLCGKTNKMVVDKKEYVEGTARYASGALVQDAFPTWNAAQREFILTLNCSCIWGE